MPQRLKRPELRGIRARVQEGMACHAVAVLGAFRDLPEFVLLLRAGSRYAGQCSVRYWFLAELSIDVLSILVEVVHALAAAAAHLLLVDYQRRLSCFGRLYRALPYVHHGYHAHARVQQNQELDQSERQ